MRKYIRNPFGIGYITTDQKWLIQTEGTPTFWLVAQLGPDTYPIEETKSYWRSYKQCKDYISWQESKS